MILKKVTSNASHEVSLISLITQQLQPRQHFVETSDMYSMKDLVDVATDVLLPELAKIHASIAQHIKTDCQVRQVIAGPSLYLTYKVRLVCLSFCLHLK